MSEIQKPGPSLDEQFKSIQDRLDRIERQQSAEAGSISTDIADVKVGDVFELPEQPGRAIIVAEDKSTDMARGFVTKQLFVNSYRAKDPETKKRILELNNLTDLELEQSE